MIFYDCVADILYRTSSVYASSMYLGGAVMVGASVLLLPPVISSYRKTVSRAFYPNGNEPYPIYISLADAAWKHPKYPRFNILPLEFGINIDIHKHEHMRFYVQTAINPQRRCLGTPDCKNMENALIYFIWLNIQAKYLIQTISFHFE